MKMRITVLFLSVMLSACHGSQGTTSTTASSPGQVVHSIQYYMDHKEERRARNKTCWTYAKQNVSLYDKDCQNAHSATLGVGDF